VSEYVGNSLGFDISKDGRFIAVHGAGIKAGKIVQVSTGENILEAGKQSFFQTNDMMIRNDSKTVFAKVGDTIHLLDIATGSFIVDFKHDRNVDFMTKSLDEAYLAASQSHDIWLWDTNERRLKFKLATVFPRILRFSHDNQIFIAYEGYNSVNNLNILEMNNGRNLKVHLNREVYDIQFSPDSKWISVALDNGEVYLWPLQYFKSIFDSEKAPVAIRDPNKLSFESGVRSMVFSDDGSFLGIAHGSNVTFVSFPKIKSNRIFSSDRPINKICFSPNNEYFAFSSEDNTARIVEIASQTEIARMIHLAAVNDIRFTPDSRYLATESRDNKLRLWLFRPNDLIAKTCETVAANLPYDVWRQYFGSEEYKLLCPNLPKYP
jgi:WD40 repeat protein